MTSIAQTINANMHALQYLLEGPRKDGLLGPKILYYGFAGWNEEIVRTACQVMIGQGLTGVIGLFDPERPGEGPVKIATVTPFCGAIKLEFCRLWQGAGKNPALLLPYDERPDAGHYMVAEEGLVHRGVRPARNSVPGERRAQRNLARRAKDGTEGRMIAFAF